MILTLIFQINPTKYRYTIKNHPLPQSIPMANDGNKEHPSPTSYHDQHLSDGRTNKRIVWSFVSRSRANSFLDQTMRYQLLRPWTVINIRATPPTPEMPRSTNFPLLLNRTSLSPPLSYSRCALSSKSRVHPF